MNMSFRGPASGILYIFLGGAAEDDRLFCRLCAGAGRWACLFGQHYLNVPLGVARRVMLFGIHGEALESIGICPEDLRF